MRIAAVAARWPAPSFTGTVWQDPIIQAPDPALLRVGRVRFEPGARTFWHTHPLGQTLHITSGIGHVQTWGGPIRQVRAGDTVWIPPGEKHWHGATPEHGMEHIAMQEAKDGEHVTWLEAGDRRAIQGKTGLSRRCDQARVKRRNSDTLRGFVLLKAGRRASANVGRTSMTAIRMACRWRHAWRCSAQRRRRRSRPI